MNDSLCVDYGSSDSIYGQYSVLHICSDRTDFPGYFVSTGIINCSHSVVEKMKENTEKIIHEELKQRDDH